MNDDSFKCVNNVLQHDRLKFILSNFVFLCQIYIFEIKSGSYLFLLEEFRLLVGISLLGKLFSISYCNKFNLDGMSVTEKMINYL